MKRTRIRILTCLVVLITVFSLSCPLLKASSEIDNDNFLLESGMREEDISRLDENIKAYIVEDLQTNASVDELEYIEDIEFPTIAPNVNQVLYGISFYVSAWKSNSTVYIYPTYEFTTAKRPRGNDSFSFQLGDAMRPHTYGEKCGQECLIQIVGHLSPKLICLQIHKR